MTFTTIHPSLLVPSGLDIGLFPMPSDLTVMQAATLLGVSEGFVDELLDDRIVSFRLENGKRLVYRNSLLDFKQRWERKNAALDEMVRIDQEMGLYND